MMETNEHNLNFEQTQKKRKEVNTESETKKKQKEQKNKLTNYFQKEKKDKNNQKQNNNSNTYIEIEPSDKREEHIHKQKENEKITNKKINGEYINEKIDSSSVSNNNNLKQKEKNNCKEKKETYKIIAINIGGTIGARLQGILKLLKEEKPQILVLTEVHKEGKNKIEDLQKFFQNYSLMHEEEGSWKRDFRRTVILLADQLKGVTKQIKHQTEKYIHIETIYQNIKINIVGAYIPVKKAKEGEKKIRKKSLEKLHEIIKNKNEEWIIIGDLNTNMEKHIEKISDFKEIEETFITQAQLPFYKQENTYEKTIRVHDKSGNNAEILTMALTTPDGALLTKGFIESSVERYEVLEMDHEISSDHKAIKLELKKDWITNTTGKLEMTGNKIPRLKLRGRSEGKKKEFNETVNKELKKIITKDLNKKSEEITKILLETAKKNYGIIEITSEQKTSLVAEIYNRYRNRIRKAIKALKNPKTNNQTEAIRNLTNNPKEWQPTLKPEDKEYKRELNKKQDQLSTLIQKEKKEFQTKRLQKLFSQKRMEHLIQPQKLFARFHQKKMIQLNTLMEGNKLITEKEEILGRIEKNWTEIYKKPTEVEIEEQDLNTGKEINFKLEDLSRLLKRLPNNKSPGPDQIPFELYRDLDKENQEFIRDFFQEIIETGIVPENWKESHTTLIHKGESPHELNNFRPIALLNTQYKIFAHLIRDQLQTFVKENKIISETQKGFNPGGSTFQNILYVHTNIERANQQKEELWELFTDITKAYDTTTTEAIVNSLKKLKISSKITQIVENIYNGNRTRITTTHGLTKPILLERGVKQGCPLSPILFNLFINNLLKELEKIPNSKTRAFADDLVNQTTDVETLKITFKTIENFLKKNGMEMNIKGTSKTVITSNLNKEEMIEKLKTVNLEKIPILEKNQNYKYLGKLINMENNEKDQKESVFFCFKLKVYFKIKQFN
jgi:hypothetical protein